MIRYSPLLVQVSPFLNLLRLPAGETMRIASSEFADDPCSSVKRGTMVRAARALLSAVTRLLILADMADVMRLLSHLKIVSANMIYLFLIFLKPISGYYYVLPFVSDSFSSHLPG